MIQRTFHRTHKFCQEIDEVRLTEELIGKIRMPRYMDPSFEHHENSELSAGLDAAIPSLVKILEKFYSSHPIIENFYAYFKGKKKINRCRHADKWMRSCGLVLDPELEAILEPALVRLMKHPDLEHLRDVEISERVLGVGSAFLQLVAIQQELDEFMADVPFQVNISRCSIADNREIAHPRTGDRELPIQVTHVDKICEMRGDKEDRKRGRW
ncbi:hypothetical protein B0H13DRAFT_1890293 [Mycena leptocephala]|nr:hypothetical protein B0H13DRAFT_1890293 [Mycena leptocephala]